MSSEVLRTKLFIPALKPNLVVRARLLTRLNEGLHQGQHFFLVSAPAGFGKSTLISQWIHSNALNAAWITLDESDNDPIRLWRHLVAALTELLPNSCVSIQEFLTAAQPPAFKTLVSALINELTGLQKPLALIFDDYHAVENEEIHNGIAYLLDHLPNQVHLCLLTRSDPPISISRLRGRGELCEIRASDLRFNSDESVDFFNAKMHLDLQIRDLAALEERTEGWIAGLQMAALSLQGVEDKHGFVTAFSGDDRYIADYLLDEVLTHQTGDIQDFLRKTSILDRMCAPLCNELTGRNDSQAILNTLDRANLFVVPLDNRREWFRYHHLFASLLRQNLIQQNGAESVGDLQHLVIAWYERNGYLLNAIEMALSGALYGPAADMIENVVEKLMVGSELTTLIKWAQQIPAAVLERHPRLCLFFAWAANAIGRNKICAEYLEICEKAIGMDVRTLLDTPQAIASMLPEDRNKILEVASIYIRLAIDELDFPRVFRQCEVILPYLTRENDIYPYISNTPSALYAPIRLMQGILLKVGSRLEEASAAFEDCVRDSLDPLTPNIHILALGYSHLGEIQTLQGKLDAAAGNFSSALLAAQDSASPSAFFSLSLAGLGLVEFERGNQAEARRHFGDAIRMAQLWNHWDSLIPASLALARLEFGSGAPEKAYQVLENLSARMQADLPAAALLAQGLLAGFRAASGSPAAAFAWSKSVEKASIGHSYFLEHGAWMRAVVYLEIEKDAEALLVLDPAIAEAEITGKQGKLIGLLSCRAAALCGLGRIEEARKSLRLALDLASTQGAFQSIADQARRLRDLLLSELRAQPEQTDAAGSRLIRRLLAVSQPTPTGLAHPAGQEWEEPLSTREQEVLGCMALGLTNSQIAARLVIAPNTIKKHVSAIFSKLNVSTRLQAIEKARSKNYLKK